MSVRHTLDQALELLARQGHNGEHRDAIEEARRWLARNEVFLDWVVQHPRLVEIHCEGRRLVASYRGEDPLPPDPARRA